MKQFDSDPKIATLASGIRIAYRVFPGKSKVPLFCIHGLTGNLRNFEPIAIALSKKGITVVTYDLRGRGNSDKPQEEYSAKIHAKDLKELASALGYSKISVLSHSLGSWVTLRFSELFPGSVEKAILVDGGGALSPKRKLSNLIMIQSSLARLGRIVPSKEAYLSEAKKSPLLSAWNEDIRNFLTYELETTGTLSTSLKNPLGVPPFGPVICSIPPFVIESELESMGGSMTLMKILRNFIRNPLRFLSILKENNRLPYGSMNFPVLLVRALKPNFKPGDELLPDYAVKRMRKEIPNLEVLELKDKNHYECVLLQDSVRDKAIRDFLSKRIP
ncbi:alpha/beta fold hydrolase [Leptospira wolffii]|uniref:Alpha/beta fold hydrolase n=1 Tax=Leptospira wolffii TaxID=409998 RepID=A0ABV5BLW8_9LEPT|nr:alpha/beta hydrolase [Leptospira wolffii]TGL49945.1 alpha/beta hydrolase [Leptospira wolffii]